MASRVVHGAPCPVAMAPAEYEAAAPRRIGVGYAATSEGHGALRAARSLAARCGATLEIIAVLHPRPWLALGGGSTWTVARPSTMHIEGRSPRPWSGRSATCGVPADRVDPAPNDPTTLLLEASRRLDILVCGSRAYEPIGSVLLGSVSRHMVDASACPVLVVPRGVGRLLEGHGAPPQAAADS